MMDRTDDYLTLKNVSKKFPGFSLSGIDFTLPKGYIMGLVGPNGAGKTTTIQLILNMLEKDTGEIFIFGRNYHCHKRKDGNKNETRNIDGNKNINRNINENIIKQNIGVVFDRVFYVDSWKVGDTEKAVSLFYDNWRHDVFNEMIDRFALPRNKRVGVFSRGMQMKLMLACAFSHDAKLLILDEPTSGLDPAARSELLEILQSYISDGERSVLFSTHITTDLERVADYITLLNKGKLVYTGSKEDMQCRYRIIKGRPQDVTVKMEKEIIGLRKTDVGFEGLVDMQGAKYYQGYTLDAATIDDIVVYVSREYADRGGVK